ncbi:glycoside hydrolase family 9 protein [Pelagicoccus albus]|uniref:Glycoside hydrolase family 9 protein n=1 Tax=Pelagicoccus albus TaxID=415222 RepID=A0A7X1B6V8_9BACT|nr:glycoside hydrolase family 9 protein [Pelagicoccus albus]MBC2606489.1 glycoside hydrolase family 9 protein [Pelagicoccus albus]
MYKNLPLSIRAAALAATTLASASPLLATEPAGPGIRLNTVGYLPEVAKTATVVGADKADRFAVIDSATGKIVLKGKLGESFDSPQTGETARLLDFGKLNKEGSYILQVPGLPDSAPFSISDEALNHSLENIMVGFYGQRCGEAVEFEWDGDTFAYDACHLDDAWLDYLEPEKAGEKKVSTGGWHDAGDYGKYTVNASFASAMMLQAWERRSEALESLELPFIPEHGGELPDFLDEIKFNLDWLITMQTENGEVAHKLTTLYFGGMVLPAEIDAKRYFTPTSKLATLDFAAVGCIAARVFRPFDAEYADTWLAAAKKAWDAAKEMSETPEDTSMFHTGGYMTSTDSDYRWALIEIRLAFGAEALSEMEGYIFKDAVDNDNRMVDVAWDWGRGYNLGLYSWLFSEEAKKDPAALERLELDLLSAADVIVRNSAEHAYGRGIRAYQWGSSGVLARSVMTLHAAHELTGEQKYLDSAYDQISYLYGRNPFGRSFVTGDGFQPPQFPHHRPSEGDQVEKPWPGHVIGGANPGELDWFDETGSYRTNETAINWDAALSYALAVFYQP